MDEQGFQDYLERRYRTRTGAPLSHKAARDMVSRCRRVEGLMKVDLDQTSIFAETEAFLETLDKDMRQQNVTPKARRDCIAALRRYVLYKELPYGRLRRTGLK